MMPPTQSLKGVDLALPRAKPRNVRLGLRYRLYRLSLKVFSKERLLERWLEDAWLSKRIAGELSGTVYGEPYSMMSGSLSPEVLLAHIEPGSRVVDIGCGSGMWVRTAATKAAYVLGLDLDPRTVAIAKEKGLPANAEFRVADARTVAEGGKFDLGLLIHVIEHLDEPVSFLRDLRAVCQRLLVEVPDFQNDPLNYIRRDLGLPFYHDADHVREYTETTLVNELRSAGWSARLVVKRHGTMLVEATQSREGLKSPSPSGRA